MALFTKDGGSEYFPTVAKKVFDVTGAGDTVISALTAALAAGAALPEAVEIANCAAGIVVGEIGTAAVNPDKLSKGLLENFANSKVDG